MKTVNIRESLYLSNIEFFAINIILKILISVDKTKINTFEKNVKDRSNNFRENWKEKQISTFTIHARNFVMAEWLAVSFTRFCMYGHRSFFILISLQEIVNCINDNGQNCDTKNDAKFLISKWIVWKVWFFFHRQVCKKVFTFFKFVSLFSNFN